VVTQQVGAGQVIAAAMIHEAHIPDSADAFAILTETPVGRRAAHRLDERSLLRPDDLLGTDQVEVPISFKSAVGVGAGDRVDVYAQVGGRTILVARGLRLLGPNVALVPAQDEALWITLAGSPTALYAARSSGLDVLVPSSGITVDDAIRGLAGIAGQGPGSAGGTPAPSPSPTR
jgi:hypothetical protein